MKDKVDSLIQRLGSVSIDPEDRKDFMVFANRFQSLPTFGATEAELMELESSLMLCLPEKIRRHLRVLYGFSDDKITWIKFEKPEQNSALSGNIQDAWYQFGIRTNISSEFERICVNQKPLLIVGLLTETLHSILAMKLDGSYKQDSQVYSFSYEDITSSGQLDSEAMTPIFKSYSALFRFVKAVELSDDEGSSLFEAISQSNISPRQN
jgi:hypothetical protein